MVPNSDTNLVFQDTSSDIEINSSSGECYVLQPGSKVFPHVVGETLTTKMVENIRKGLEGQISSGRNIIYIHGDLARDLIVSLMPNYEGKNVGLFYSESEIPDNVTKSMRSNFGGRMTGIRINEDDLRYYDK